MCQQDSSSRCAALTQDTLKCTTAKFVLNLMMLGLQVESDEICDIVCRERNRLAGTSTATFACLHAQQCYADLALAVMSAIGTGSMPNFTAPFQCSQKCPEEMSAACMSYVSRNHAKLLGLTEIGTWL
jgi:hypothetical protein